MQLFRFLCLSIFIFNLIDVSISRANDAGHGSEAKKVESDYSGMQNDDWMKAQKDLQAAQAKYENAQKELEKQKEISLQRENLTSATLTAINAALKNVKDTEKEYKELLSEYNTRYPEKGQSVGRKYERLSGSKESKMQHNVLEKPQTLEEKVQTLNQKLKKQYGSVEETLKNDVNIESKKKKDKKTKTAEQHNDDGIIETILLEK